jgi:hypothetical protein
MSADSRHLSERLPSGKIVRRDFGEDGTLTRESHSYGILDILIGYSFSNGVKTDETYMFKRRLVSRRSYEKARTAYADMPPADNATEDFSGALLRDVRREQRRNKAEAERRLAESAESRFPRPASTNWLRVISGDKAHLVIFASRDWKVLSRERTIPTGREWMTLFGFSSVSDSEVSSVASGLVVGYEVTGNRRAMLKASRALLAEVQAFVQSPPETSQWQGSIRPRPKPRRKLPLAWPTVLPPLIEFLSGLKEPTVKIFNHHR